MMSEKNVAEDVIELHSGNKTGLDSERDVDIQDIISFTKSINITYLETSALTDQNIENLFNESLTTFIKSHSTPNKDAKINFEPEKRSSCC